MKLFFNYLKKLIQFGRVKLLFNTLLVFILGFTESINLLILVPLLSLVGITASNVDWLNQFNNVFNLNQYSIEIRLLIVIGIYLTISIGQSAFSRVQSINKMTIQNGFLSQLSVNLFQDLSHAPWALSSKYSKSEITHMMTQELGRVGIATQQFLNLFSTILIAVIELVIALVISPWLTLTAIAAGIVFAGISYPVVKLSKKTGQLISQKTLGIYENLLQHFQGLKEVKVYGLEQSQITSFYTLRMEIDAAFLEIQRLNTKTDLLFKIGSAFLVASFLYLSLGVFSLSAQEFILLTVLFSRLWPKFSSLQLNIQSLAMMLPAFENVQAFERSLNLDKMVSSNQLPKHLPDAFDQSITLQRVSFSYDRQPILKDISLTIQKGEMVAIIGPSGVGKSTLIDVILGLQIPQQGQVLIDGQLETNVLGRLHQTTGYVAQHPSLMNMSIRENLLWVKPNATDQEIFTALKKASIDTFVSSLKDGLDTIVGDQGARLSGGEKQRLILARALLRQPSLLVLDEPTSAIDAENEQSIMDALINLKGQVTIVLIAHRLSTIQHANHIIFLEENKLEEYPDFMSLLHARKDIKTIIERDRGQT